MEKYRQIEIGVLDEKLIQYYINQFTFFILDKALETRTYRRIDKNMITLLQKSIKQDMI